MRNILVIDNDATSIATFKSLLATFGYTVVGISDSIYTMDAIRANKPELIFIDWAMPQMDGLQIIRLIRKYIEYDDIPLVLSTDHRLNVEDLKQALDAGAFDYIRKPLDEFELPARVATIFKLIDHIKRNIDLAIQAQRQEFVAVEQEVVSLQNKLQEKQREMAVMSVNVYQNQKFLSKFKSDILGSDVSFDAKQQAHLSSVFGKYYAISNSLNWNFFEKGFVQLHTSFYTVLSREFGQLTWSDLRLCAFLRIGMTMKEISIVNYSTYETVKKAVHRLRKKLRITETEDINLFLQKY